ncbi:hypothetical protein HN371_28365 [Candidatus Poribacteria bacterium]|jgi:hypothetical protein|nr:hypothetical protein [Candidatus Poribacteria bacterium]MBT5532198.1 hypothetical protein [Candidatus Poribacteria bacterium]MBT7806885.1 hypothetical protein [Candidatus Poribacteria bacterium]
MSNGPLATGTVDSLCINGEPVESIRFRVDGPDGDSHSASTRKLAGHDGRYIRTSDLAQGKEVFNWRTWTGLAAEEIAEVEATLGLDIPQGCLLENITVSGIAGFSQLDPTSRLVFPSRGEGADLTQAVLAVWEENGPCATVGERLEKHHAKPGLKTDFIRAAQGKRGVMGLVLSAGEVRVGDTVLAYPPVK